VLLADDNYPYRMFLRALVEKEPDMVVVGEAGNGSWAAQQAQDLLPDVVLMDVDMPGLDGLAAARKLQTQGVPSRVIALTGLTPDQVASRHPTKATEIIYKNRRVNANWNARLLDGIRNAGTLGKSAEMAKAPMAHVTLERPPKVVLMGASTGGPQAVAAVLRGLPSPLRLPVLMVIHVAESFAKPMAEWLSHTSGKPVRMARNGEVIADAAGECLLAPEGTHMTVSDGCIALVDGAPIHGVCPAVDPLFDSAASHYGGQAVAALLTGMGRDGASGLSALHQNGALTIAQDESTCVVFGMPAQAIARGAARVVLPLPRIAAAIKPFLTPVKPAPLPSVPRSEA
jgi:two-component system chemotaxis response regulator CheB